MRDLRIAFMGTPEFAVASLEALLNEQFNVVAVVTAPDRPAGRGRKLRASAVKQSAIAHELPVLQPTNLKNPDFLAELKALKVNLLVVVAFRMLPESIWSFPRYGTFNLHASLLPDYRGAAPINWAIINGDSRTGATTFFIEQRIDTGNIILQEELPITTEENAGQLHDRLKTLGADLVVRTARAIASGTVTTRSQKHLESAKKAPKLNRDNCRINWDQPMQRIFNLIRGLSPYPAAWTIHVNGSEEKQVKIFAARKTDRHATGNPGLIRIEGKQLLVHTSDYLLEVLELQLEGKRRMPVVDFINGVQMAKKSFFR
jgi:methionyl-tRNA formyltransferase